MKHWYLILLCSTTIWCNTHNEYEAALNTARQYKNAEQFDKAIEAYTQALQIIPGSVNAYFELAIIYIMLGQTRKAIAIYDAILHAFADNVPVIYNKGYALKMEGACDEAIACYKAVLALDDSYDAAHFALGMAYLSKGDFETGWKQHERFLKQMNRNGDLLRSFLANGTTKDKVIVLQPEGGLGDTLQFIRYAKELQKYGMRVIVAVQKQLYDLLKNLPYVDQIQPVGKPITYYDDRTTLMSIPAILYSHEHRLPTFEPYIFPDQALVDYWGDRLDHDTKFKIGICWESSVYNDSSRPPVARRGMPLETLYKLSTIKGISLYCLQQVDGMDQLKQLPDYVKIYTFDDTFDKEHGSFMDTAAVMQHMDLIISVDTAVAHLAGAMGRPVWLMLPYATDWRWIAQHTTSPWYPTMRIFQQPSPFDWNSVVDKIYEALSKKLKS